MEVFLKTVKAIAYSKLISIIGNQNNFARAKYFL